jgi:hypothetical protein
VVSHNYGTKNSLLEQPKLTEGILYTTNVFLLTEKRDGVLQDLVFLGQCFYYMQMIFHSTFKWQSMFMRRQYKYVGHQAG